MQNGAPDGLALVDSDDNVRQFISYEGTFTAVGGPAGGMVSTNIGVDEQPAPEVGASLQLSGTGAAYEDFAWTMLRTSENASVSKFGVSAKSSVVRIIGKP